MKDIHKVSWLSFLAALPLILVVFVPFATMSRLAEVVTFEWLLLLILSAAFALLVFWKTPILKHYNNALAEFEDNYRYVKEEAIIIDENWGTSDAGAPEEGDDYVA